MILLVHILFIIFMLQVGILLVVNMVSMLLIFPAVLSLDAWRKSNDRVDVFCCIESAISAKVKDISVLPPPSPNAEKHNTVAYSLPSGMLSWLIHL